MTDDSLLVVNLGLAPYGETLELMRGLAWAKKERTTPQVLFLCEHRPVFTMGRRAQESDLLAPRETLVQMGFEVHNIERGGLITYHGPGQQVAYPVLHLKTLGLSVPKLVNHLEQAMIVAMAGFGIEAGRKENHPGVWIGPDKIASIGLAVKGGVTLHGLALNVDPDLGHFNLINPCGLTHTKIVSMASVKGEKVEVSKVGPVLADELAGLLGLPAKPCGLDEMKRVFGLS